MQVLILASVCAALLMVPVQAAELRAAEDRILSPYTGYTRAHWLEITEQLIAGVLPYFGAADGLPDLRSTPAVEKHFEHLTRGETRTEAFGRTLILVAIYTAATGNDRVPGYKGSITRPYLNGLIVGTEPDSEHHWGQQPRYSAFGTNVSLAILLSPEFLWDPLTSRQRANVLEFIHNLVKTPAFDCNCWYFQLMGVPLLEREGISYDRERMAGIFERLLNWYRGDGWFIDGGNFTYDYYNLWGFQLYNNALCQFDPGWKERFGERVRRTTGEFQRSYTHLYGRDGGPIPWGRSLTYRFASVSALGWALINGTNTLPPGQARRIASGCLRYFWERGCLSDNGLLEPGYHGPNAVAPETYIARASPYWAAHGLAPLVLPPEHPFWTDTEQPIPADGAGGRLALPGAEMVLRVSPIDGEARQYPIGSPPKPGDQWQRGAKYFQHAYSSYLGFALPGEGGPDVPAGRTGISFDGQNWCYRANPRPLRVAADHSASTYDIRLDPVDAEFEEFGEVITHTLIGDDGEVHAFWHTSARPAYLTIAGYGISVPHNTSLQRKQAADRIAIRAGEFRSLMAVVDAPAGDLSSERLEPRPGWRHAHLFGGAAAYPYWRSREPVPPYIPVVIFVNGARGRDPGVPATSASVEDGLLRMGIGEDSFEVRLPF